jgi:putative MATE family efflux protein
MSFVDGAVGRMLIRRTIPMVLGLLSMIAFNLVDMFYIGRLGTQALAAISFTFPVIFVVGSVTLGIGIGVSATVSRAIGRGDQEQVRRLTTDSLVLAVMTAAVFGLLGLCTMDPLFRVLGASDQLQPLIREYMSIWYPGMICVVIPMIGNNAIRATGNTWIPGLVMFIAVIINAILDPLLIFGPGPFPAMGMAGAAASTVLSRAFTLFVSLWVLGRRYRMLASLSISHERLWQSWRQVLAIGVPGAATQMIVPLGVGIITNLVARYGPEAVAALGVASRVEGLALIVVSALASVLTPFIGQNRGASRVGRIEEGIRRSYQFAVGWGVFAAGILWISAPWIGPVFTDDRQVIDLTTLYLRIVPLGYAFQGILVISGSALNVLHRPLQSMCLSLIYMFGLYIPLAYGGAALAALSGIFFGAVVSRTVAGVMSKVWMRRVMREEQARVGEEVFEWNVADSVIQG